MTLKTTGLNELLESCNTYSENNSIIKERITDLEARVNDFVIERNYEETKVNAAHVVLKLVTESLKEGLFLGVEVMNPIYKINFARYIRSKKTRRDVTSRLYSTFKNLPKFPISSGARIFFAEEIIDLLDPEHCYGAIVGEGILDSEKENYFAMIKPHYEKLISQISKSVKYADKTLRNFPLLTAPYFDQLINGIFVNGPLAVLDIVKKNDNAAGMMTKKHVERLIEDAAEDPIDYSNIFRYLPDKLFDEYKTLICVTAISNPLIYQTMQELDLFVDAAQPIESRLNFLMQYREKLRMNAGALSISPVNVEGGELSLGYEENGLALIEDLE